MADFTTITNLRGPAARITEVSAESVPSAQSAVVEMTGPDQGRAFKFKIPRGLPGVNALENDEAIATYLLAPDTDTAKAVAATVGRGLSVASYGAVGDLTTDDTAAIQAALDAGGDGSTITLVPGKKYRVTGSLITHLWQRIEGAAIQNSTGGTAPAELVFDVSGSTAGIRARSYTYLKDLLIRGPGDAVGTCIGVQMYDGTSNAISMENVSINDWATGAHLNGVYYGWFQRPEFRRNGVGLRITSSLNITINNPQINAQRAGGTPGVGIDGCARALSIFGGSIEQFQSGIKVFHSETLNLFGVYFESTIAAANVRAIDTAALINTTINIYGCYIYMPNLTTFLEMRGGTNRVLNAHGNSFIAGAASANVSGSVAYRFSAGHSIDIGGDNWIRVETALTTYMGIDGGTLPYPNVRVDLPVGHPLGSGIVYDGKLPARPVQRIAHNVAGALTIDPRYGTVEVTLGANVTSVVLASTGIDNQELTFTLVQPVGGAFTFVQPSVFRWNANTAPATPAANTRTTVVYQFNAATGRWFEKSRSVGMGN